MKKQNIWIRLTGEILIYTLCYAIMLVLVIGISCGLNIGGILNFLTTENYCATKFCYGIAIMNGLLCMWLESRRGKRIEAKVREEMEWRKANTPPPGISIDAYGEVDATIYFLLMSDAIAFCEANKEEEYCNVLGNGFKIKHLSMGWCRQFHTVKILGKEYAPEI